MALHIEDVLTQAIPPQECHCAGLAGYTRHGPHVVFLLSWQFSHLQGISAFETPPTLVSRFVAEVKTQTADGICIGDVVSLCGKLGAGP